MPLIACNEDNNQHKLFRAEGKKIPDDAYLDSNTDNEDDGALSHTFLYERVTCVLPHLYSCVRPSE